MERFNSLSNWNMNKCVSFVPNFTAPSPTKWNRATTKSNFFRYLKCNTIYPMKATCIRFAYNNLKILPEVLFLITTGLQSSKISYSEVSLTADKASLADTVLKVERSLYAELKGTVSANQALSAVNDTSEYEIFDDLKTSYEL